jgi:hypothetical protein
VLVARGELDIDFGKELSAMASNWIEAKRASEFEERLTIVEQAINQNIQVNGHVVVGGLPTIPGCEGVLMPGMSATPTNAHDNKPPLIGPDPTNGGP